VVSQSFVLRGCDAQSQPLLDCATILGFLTLWSGLIDPCLRRGKLAPVQTVVRIHSAALRACPEVVEGTDSTTVR